MAEFVNDFGSLVKGSSKIGLSINQDLDLLMTVEHLYKT